MWANGNNRHEAVKDEDLQLGRKIVAGLRMLERHVRPLRYQPRFTWAHPKGYERVQECFQKPVEPPKAGNFMTYCWMDPLLVNIFGDQFGDPINQTRNDKITTLSYSDGYVKIDNGYKDIMSSNAASLGLPRMQDDVKEWLASVPNGPEVLHPASANQ
jgi:hypothetical protein